MSARIIWVTPEAEKEIAYCARVSNPDNQDNPDYEKLLKYCITNKHWSIFEVANLCVEIKTSRGIAQQILRHRSFSFQEFSQRYAKVSSIEPVVPRRQDTKNRQNSIDDLSQDDKWWFESAKSHIDDLSMELYDEAISRGIAKECARFLLPIATSTTMYMNGTVRSWMHYLLLRTGHGTQKEHMDIANEIKEIFIKEFPIISKALGWIV